MYTFHCFITRKRPPELIQREWNNMVRAAMIDGLRPWITESLPKHFEPGAVQRYSYTARSNATNRRKRNQKSIKLKSGAVISMPSPPAPDVWSAETKKSLLSRSPESFNIRASVTSKICKVRLALPIPHPMNKKFSGELVRLTKDELAQIHRRMIASLKERIASLNEPVRKQVC